MPIRQIIVALFTFLAWPTLVFAHGAHVHGIAALDVALDAKTLSLQLRSPLMNLIGFEHVPNSNADRHAVQAMATTMRHASSLFITTPAAQCRIDQVRLASTAIAPALLGETQVQEVVPDQRDDHANLDADVVFQCEHPERLQHIDVKLFAAFKGFARIDVQLVTARRQSAVKLTPASAILSMQ